MGLTLIPMGSPLAGGYGQTRSGSLRTSQPSVRRLQEGELKGEQEHWMAGGPKLMREERGALCQCADAGRAEK